MKEMMESIPSLWYQSDPQRLNQTDIPLGWVREAAPLRPYAQNLFAIVGTSGCGRDTLLDAMMALSPALARVRRTTTRPPRYPNESVRILSLSDSSFVLTQKNQKILCPYRYPPNGKWYGISQDELKKITLGPAVLEGTAEILPLKMLLPESTTVIIVPQSFTQLKRQLICRDGNTSETKKRIERSQRELAILLTRLPQLLETNTINGIVINDDTPKNLGVRALAQIQTKVWPTAVPQELQTDITNYLSQWNRCNI